MMDKIIHDKCIGVIKDAIKSEHKESEHKVYAYLDEINIDETGDNSYLSFSLITEKILDFDGSPYVQKLYGTIEKVPLKDGNIAEDVKKSGKEGETYTTSAISDEVLSDEYELVETPLNANGTYSGDEVIVTYYYKKVSRDVNLIKYQEDGATPLEGAKFAIENKDDSKNNIIVVIK